MKKAIDRTKRILTIYYLFYECEEIEFREITDPIPVSKKTVYRDIRFLEQAGLIRARFDHRAQAFIPQSTEGLQPVFPENQTQRRYMERIIRLCYIMTHIDGEENPIAWYTAQFPKLSARTRQRDFALLNELGISIYYAPQFCDEPGHWVCDAPDAFGLSTLHVKPGR